MLPRSKVRRSCGSFTWFISLCLAFCLLTPNVAWPAQVKVPLEIDYITLAAALKRQMFNGPDGRAVLWTGSDKCQHLYAYDPQFTAARDGALSLEMKGELGLGLAVGGKCVTPLTWSGIVEVETPPYISELTIKFHVTNINLYNPQHEKSLLVGHGFDLIKENIIPRIETFSYDLNAPLRDLEGLVRAAATPEVAQRVTVALSTLRPMSGVIAGDSGLKLTLELSVPEVAAPPTSPSAPSAPLTPEEITAWQSVLDNWDAFVVFAIKQLGDTTTDVQLREQLFDILLDSRYRLVDALARPQTGPGPDPIRLIFLDVWTRLGTAIRTAAQHGILGDRAVEFLSFVTAGNALFALDQAAPALGMRVSTDDLRRLAHMMAPLYTADPLAFSYDTDPQLRQMFGVSEPLESLGPLEAPPGPDTLAPATTIPPATSSPAVTPTPEGSSAAVAPKEYNPSPTPGSFVTPEATPTTSTRSMLQIPLLLFGPTDADAAAEDPLVSQILALGAALKRVVVDANNAVVYVRSVRNLLTLIAQHESAETDLQRQFRHNYVLVVKSTAWQESCWRHFVRVNGRVWFLESDTGDVGIMQVNKHVWRGFYSIPRLEWDIVYNTSAGSQILIRLMRGAQARQSRSKTDPADADIARATYAAYNGGPNEYDRWRRANEPAELRQIDESFWTKYRAMAAGESFNILQCRNGCGKPNCH